MSKKNNSRISYWIGRPGLYLLVLTALSACESASFQQSQVAAPPPVPTDFTPSRVAQQSTYASQPMVGSTTSSISSAGRIAIGTGAQQILSYYRSAGHILSSAQSGGTVKQLMLRTLPNDLKSMKVGDKKEVFIMTALPLILKVNEEIRGLRRQIQSSGCGGAISTCQNSAVLDMAEAYHVNGTIDDLLIKIDEIPVSLALAQAIEESGWGTSRFAKDGNALFGQRTWDSGDTGLVPRKRDKGESYRVRSFETLLESVRVYARNVNRHQAYSDMRARRARAKQAGRVPSGAELIQGMRKYSTTGSAYIRNITTIIEKNNLRQYDHLRLDHSQPATELVSG